MRYAAVAVAVVAALLLAVAAPSEAGSRLAFQKDLFGNVRSDNPNWVICGQVKFKAPSKGTVVVTASGQALFNSSDFTADLYLSLSKTPNVGGPWVFGITPGTEPVQTYTVRRTFPVNGNTTTTFYLNGSSVNGNGHNISVQTSCITVEFYASGNVQTSAEAAAPQAEAQELPEPTPGNALSNIH